MDFIIKPEVETVSIVLRGSFNPVIFTPSWFEKNDLIASEAQDAEIDIIHAEVVSFKTDWLTFNTDKNSLLVQTHEEPWVRGLDLVEKTFVEFLPHTPLVMLGINRKIHFPAQPEACERIGNLLGPKEPWGEWGEKISSGAGDNHGGMRIIGMEIRDLEDRQKGFIGISVSPSKEESSGILVDINDHYEFPEVIADSSIGAAQAMEALRQQFAGSLERSKKIANQIMSLI